MLLLFLLYLNHLFFNYWKLFLKLNYSAFDFLLLLGNKFKLVWDSSEFFKRYSLLELLLQISKLFLLFFVLCLNLINSLCHLHQLHIMILLILLQNFLILSQHNLQFMCFFGWNLNLLHHKLKRWFYFKKWLVQVVLWVKYFDQSLVKFSVIQNCI